MWATPIYVIIIIKIPYSTCSCTELTLFDMASISLLILLSLSLCSAHNVSAVQFAVMVSSRADLNTTGIVLSAVGDAVEVVNRNVLSKGVTLKYKTIVTDVRKINIYLIFLFVPHLLFVCLFCAVLQCIQCSAAAYRIT